MISKLRIKSQYNKNIITEVSDISSLELVKLKKAIYKFLENIIK